MSSRTWLLAALLAALPVSPFAQEVDDDDSASVADFAPDDDDSRVTSAPAPEHGKAATADASPVDPGVLEVEVGYAPVWSERGGVAGFHLAENAFAHGFGGTLTYGVVSGLDVKLSSGFGAVYDRTARLADPAAPVDGAGASDLGVGARWRFLQLSEQSLELAVTADATIPTGTSAGPHRLGLSQEFWSARGALVATKDWGDFTANGEVAWATPISGDAGGLRSVAQVNAAVGWQVAPWLQPELELNYQAAIGPGSHVLTATAGVVAPFGAGNRVVAAVQHAVWGQNATQTSGAILAFKTAL